MTDYYKVARSNGWDGHTGNTVNYRNAIGTTVYPPNPDPTKPWVCRAGILHAYGTLASAQRHTKEFIDKGYGYSIYRVQGTPVAQDSNNPEAATYGFVSLYVVEEIT